MVSVKAPHLDLALLQTLIAFSETGSLARAAGRVGRTQSAVSLQMQRLEQTLGARIFNKQGRSLALNEAGQSMVGYAERMLLLNAEAIAYARGHSAVGSVRLGISVDFEHTWLPRAMASFAKAHPKVEVQLRVDRNAALERAVANQEIDIALVFAAASEASSASTVPMAWIAHHTFEWPRDTELPLLLLEHPCLFRTAALESLANAHIGWRVAVTSPSLGGVWATASAGMGVTVRSAVNIPRDLQNVGDRLGLPPLPGVAVRIVESNRKGSKARANLRQVMKDIASELLRV